MTEFSPRATGPKHPAPRGFPQPVCGLGTGRATRRSSGQHVGVQEEEARARPSCASAAKKEATPFFTRRRVAAVAVAAAAVAVVLIGASLLSARDDGDDGGATTAITGGADVEALLDGIPQSGTVLGEDDAAVTLVEYADLQCPFCAEWSLRTFPELVADYVRDGELRIEFRGLTFIGPEFEQAPARRRRRRRSLETSSISSTRTRAPRTPAGSLRTSCAPSARRSRSWTSTACSRRATRPRSRRSRRPRPTPRPTGSAARPPSSSGETGGELSALRSRPWGRRSSAT